MGNVLSEFRVTIQAAFQSEDNAPYVNQNRPAVVRKISLSWNEIGSFLEKLNRMLEAAKETEVGLLLPNLHLVAGPRPTTKSTSDAFRQSPPTWPRSLR